jgi:hypothetical protein
LLSGCTLDDLLGNEEPHGTFHDAVVRAVHVDYATQELSVDLELCVGNPDAAGDLPRERRRRGRLQVEGLRVWALDPPGSGGTIEPGGLWLTADGPLSECPTETGRALSGLTNSGINWYLYFNDLNAFAYVVGARASFTWL